MAPPKGKGKDLSRMSAPGPSPTSAPSPRSSMAPSQPAGAGGAAAPKIPSPRLGKPKGKDFSRMTGPPPSAAQPPPAAAAVPQPPTPVVPNKTSAASGSLVGTIRRQNAARVAAGMKPFTVASTRATTARPPSVGVVDNKSKKPLIPAVVKRRTSNHQSVPPPQVKIPPASYATQPQALRHQPLVPNTAPHVKQQQCQITVAVGPTQVQKKQQQLHKQHQLQPLPPQANAPKSNVASLPPKKDVPQPTQRPSWAEARLPTLGARRSSNTPSASSTSKSQDGFGKPSLAPILGMKLQALCHSIDPSYSLDSEVQERLVEMTDSFVNKVTRDAIKLSKHRGSKCLDVVDVALALKKGYNMEVPGLGPPSVGAAGGEGGRQGMGGWLFVDKFNQGVNDQPKKRKVSGAAAAASAM